MLQTIIVLHFLLYFHCVSHIGYSIIRMPFTFLLGVVFKIGSINGGSSIRSNKMAISSIEHPKRLQDNTILWVTISIRLNTRKYIILAFRVITLKVKSILFGVFILIRLKFIDILLYHISVSIENTK